MSNKNDAGSSRILQYEWAEWKAPGFRKEKQPRDRQIMNARLAPVLNYFDPDTGDILELVSKEMRECAPEDELEMLPRVDPLQPYWNFPNSLAEMLRPVIHRAQRQYAHELFKTNMVDVAVTWELYEGDEDYGTNNPFKRMAHMEFDDTQTMKTAWNAMYKILEVTGTPHEPARFAEQQPEGEDAGAGDNYDPDLVPNASLLSRPGSSLPTPEVEHVGGFYARVPLTFYTSRLEPLNAKYSSHGVRVTPIMKPKQMTPQQVEELKALWAERVGV